MKMRSRIIACITLLFFCAVYVVGQDLYTFGGAGSILNGQDARDWKLSDQVGYVLGKLKDTQNQVIIAQSLGGLRALGYAYQLKIKHQTDPATYPGNVKEIIAVDSPVLGYSPLLQGKDVLVQKICNGKSCVVNGVSAAADVCLLPNTGIIAGEIVLNGIVLSDPIVTKRFTDDLHLNGAYVADVTPNSPFLTNNVLPPWIPDQGHWEEQVVWDEYDLCYTTQLVFVVDVPGHYDLSRSKLDPSVKVGFIVGRQNDPIKFVSNMLYNPRGDVVSGDEANIRYWIGQLNTVLQLGGSLATTVAAAYYGTMAGFCWSAYSITSNIPGFYVKFRNPPPMAVVMYGRLCHQS
jgi:hypothetical protein